MGQVFTWQSLVLGDREVGLLPSGSLRMIMMARLAWPSARVVWKGAACLDLWMRGTPCPVPIRKPYVKC